MLNAAMLGAVLLAASPETDNALHVVLSASAAGACYGAAALLTDDTAMRIAFAAAVPLAAGLGREYTQAQRGGWQRENTRDMGRNIAGIAFAVLFSYAVQQAYGEPCYQVGDYRVCVGASDI